MCLVWADCSMPNVGIYKYTAVFIWEPDKVELKVATRKLGLINLNENHFMSGVVGTTNTKSSEYHWCRRQINA